MDVSRPSAPVTLEQVCLSCTLIYRETLLRRRVYAKAVLSQVGQVDGGELLIDIRGISRVDSRPASSTTFYNHRERETVCATTSYKCTTHRHVTEDQNPARLPLLADFPSSNNEPQMCSTLLYVLYVDSFSETCMLSVNTLYLYIFQVGLC